MRRPLFSVVIPTYDRASLLPEAIKSILEQRCSYVQIIVVDDGSTDNTRDVVREYGCQIEYFFQSNQGPAAARNRGLAAAEGEFICFLDSDDVWQPGKLQTELQLFVRFSRAEAIISDSEHWYHDQLVLASRFRKLGLATASGLPELLPKPTSLWLDRSLVSTCCLTFRRSALAKMGPTPFDRSLDNFEDWDFEIRLYNACDVVVNPYVVATIRRFEDHTRKGRAVPGTEPSPAQVRCDLISTEQVLRKSLGLPRLDHGVAAQIQTRLREVTSDLAAMSGMAGAV